MNKAQLHISSYLIFFIMIVLSSCQKANTAESRNTTLKKQQGKISIGNLVSEMDKKIMVVFQSKNGSYWFGSGDQGVYKYDGKELVQYTIKEGLCSNVILGIQEDKFENLYFDTPMHSSYFEKIEATF